MQPCLKIREINSRLDVKSLISFDQGVMTNRILHGLCTGLCNTTSSP